MENKKDNIYIYLWEEFNTIYVGRTINPKSRHYQHRHIPTESTYKFSSEHHAEHPKMIIIENDLTIEEGIEREKYWINYYKENSPYNVLNKSRGGQTGQQKTRLTEEEKIKRIRERDRKRYPKRKEYSKEYNKKYREKHREELRLKERKYRKEHKEEFLSQRKKYREENREKILAYKRKYREKHREELRLKAREYWEEHREEKREYDKIHREKLKNKA